MMFLIGWFNNNTAGLGKPGPSGVDLICNIATYVSLLVSEHLFSVHSINLMNTSTAHCFDGGMMMILLAVCY